MRSETGEQMSVEDDIAGVAEQERRLVFKAFDEPAAREIGETIRTLAEAAGVAIVIDVRFWDRQLYYYAMPGTSADNPDWVRRKSNCVRRYGRSSFSLMLRHESQGRGFQPHHNADPSEFAPHGGSFPIRIEGVGVIGSISVSGAPSRRDHGLVVEAICRHLGVDHSSLALPLEGFGG